MTGGGVLSGKFGQLCDQELFVGKRSKHAILLANLFFWLSIYCRYGQNFPSHSMLGISQKQLSQHTNPEVLHVVGVDSQFFLNSTFSGGIPVLDGEVIYAYISWFSPSFLEFSRGFCAADTRNFRPIPVQRSFQDGLSCLDVAHERGSEDPVSPSAGWNWSDAPMGFFRSFSGLSSNIIRGVVISWNY